jgi:Flp pilus assembly protein TadG
MNLFRTFWLEKSGAVALMFALMVIPLVGFVGVAVDYSRLSSADLALQNSLDMAALAAGRAYANTVGSDAERVEAATAKAVAFFDANFNSQIEFVAGPDLVVTPTGETVDVSATAELKTSFLWVLGIMTMQVDAGSQVKSAGRGMELVLIMDNTGSMRSSLGNGNSKMETMKASATELVYIMYGGREEVENFWVGLVPYVAMVNVSNSRSNWVNYYPSNDFVGTSWKGCVMARPDPYDETDDTEATEPWDVMAWPSTKNVKYYDKYGDRIKFNYNGTTYKVKGDNEWPNINEENSAQNNGTGPNLGCGPAITPLVSSRQTILDSIDEMLPWHRGGTMANLGMAWGWRVISPKWRGLWEGDTPDELPLEYGNPKFEKVAILLTDGNNQWYDWPGNSKKDNTPINGLPGAGGFSNSSGVGYKKNKVIEDADYTAYGRITEGRLGSTDFDEVQGILDDKMLQVCSDMKREGIQVYTITFGSTNSATKQTYANCASRPDQYYDSPSNSELRAAFVAIATELNNLRISQ